MLRLIINCDILKQGEAFEKLSESKSRSGFHLNEADRAYTEKQPAYGVVEKETEK